MKSSKNIKIIYFIISLSLLIFSLISNPFIECSSIDEGIYRKILVLFSSCLFIPNIVNISKIKKKSIINVVFVLIGIVSSLYIYNTHSKDYKIRNGIYFKSILQIDKKISSDSVVTASKELDISNNSDSNKELDGNLLKVNYIDVGQGIRY